MTKSELMQKCGLEENELINTNLGFMDVLEVKDDIVTLGVLASGRIITESVESVISKLKNSMA